MSVVLSVEHEPARPALREGTGSGETLDAICGGAVRLLQRQHGYRFNLDPLLLADFVHRAAAPWRGRLVDLGTGVGVIPLVLARRYGHTHLTGLELQPGLFELAERNVHLNRAERAVSLVLGDLRHVQDKFAPGAFRQVVCNPPYRARRAGRVNLEEEKALARHELACSLADVVRATDYLLPARGGLSLVYPASRSAELLATLHAARLTPRLLRLVHPRADRPAKLALVHAVKGARADLTVLPPLVLHTHAEQSFTAEVRAILG